LAPTTRPRAPRHMGPAKVVSIRRPGCATEQSGRRRRSGFHAAVHCRTVGSMIVPQVRQEGRGTAAFACRAFRGSGEEPGTGRRSNQCSGKPGRGSFAFAPVTNRKIAIRGLDGKSARNATEARVAAPIAQKSDGGPSSLAMRGASPREPSFDSATQILSRNRLGRDADGVLRPRTSSSDAKVALTLLVFYPPAGRGGRGVVRALPPRGVGGQRAPFAHAKRRRRVRPRGSGDGPYTTSRWSTRGPLASTAHSFGTPVSDRPAGGGRRSRLREQSRIPFQGARFRFTPGRVIHRGDNQGPTT